MTLVHCGIMCTSRVTPQINHALIGQKNGWRWIQAKANDLTYHTTSDPAVSAFLNFLLKLETCWSDIIIWSDTSHVLHVTSHVYHSAHSLETEAILGSFLMKVCIIWKVPYDHFEVETHGVKSNGTLGGLKTTLTVHGITQFSGFYFDCCTGVSQMKTIFILYV